MPGIKLKAKPNKFAIAVVFTFAGQRESSKQFGFFAVGFRARQNAAQRERERAGIMKQK